jgi:hypothetical protein
MPELTIPQLVKKFDPIDSNPKKYFRFMPLEVVTEARNYFRDIPDIKKILLYLRCAFQIYNVCTVTSLWAPHEKITTNEKGEDKYAESQWLSPVDFSWTDMDTVIQKGKYAMAAYADTIKFKVEDLEKISIINRFDWENQSKKMYIIPILQLEDAFKYMELGEAKLATKNIISSLELALLTLPP